MTKNRTLRLKIRIQLAPGRPQEALRANSSRFLDHFGVILGPQMVILGPSWDAFGSNQQQTAAKIGK